MGCSIFMLRAEFFIAQEHHSSVLETVKRLDPKVFDPVSPEPHFSFVSTSAYQKATTIYEMLLAWRWLAECDEADNINAIEFIGEKLGDDAILFEAISPFVRDGSDIQMAGEDGRIWRWIFMNGAMQEQEGEITFHSSPPQKVDKAQ